jgi:hypothetical protein
LVGRGGTQPRMIILPRRQDHDSPELSWRFGTETGAMSVTSP